MTTEIKDTDKKNDDPFAPRAPRKRGQGVNAAGSSEILDDLGHFVAGPLLFLYTNLEAILLEKSDRLMGNECHTMAMTNIFYDTIGSVLKTLNEDMSAFGVNP